MNIDASEIRILIRLVTQRTGSPVHDDDLTQEVTTVQSQSVASLARHDPMQQRKDARRPSGVLETFHVRPTRTPALVEVDEKAAIFPVQAASRQGLEYVTPQRAPRLLSDGLGTHRHVIMPRPDPHHRCSIVARPRRLDKAVEAARVLLRCARR